MLTLEVRALCQGSWEESERGTVGSRAIRWGVEFLDGNVEAGMGEGEENPGDQRKVSKAV